MDPLARFDVSFNINWDRVLPHSTGHFKLHKKLETAISFLFLSPTINIKAIESVFSNSKAVILAGYGMGNLPTDNKELMAILRKAVQEGTIVVIKTQCHKGTVDDLYETGKRLTEMGCILALDMTVECLYAKIAYLFGKGYSNEKIKKMMMKNLRGEITVTKKDKYQMTNSKLILAVANAMHASDHESITAIRETLTPILLNSIVANNELPVIKQLVQEQGANLSKCDYFGRAALHVAARTKGSLEVLMYLCSRQINLD